MKKSIKKETIDPLEQAEVATKKLNNKLKKSGGYIFKKYPLSFSLFSSVGFSLILYGFEGLFDNLFLFREYPSLPLALGLFILLITGTIYKRLQNRNI